MSEPFTKPMGGLKSVGAKQIPEITAKVEKISILRQRLNLSEHRRKEMENEN